MKLNKMSIQSCFPTRDSQSRSSLVEAVLSITGDDGMPKDILKEQIIHQPTSGELCFCQRLCFVQRVTNPECYLGSQAT